MTELRRNAFPEPRSGTTNGDSNVPVFPSPFSRATNFRVYLPGASVNPVSYWICLRVTSPAVVEATLTGIVSRTTEACRPWASRISPMKSSSVAALAPLLLERQRRTGNAHGDGHEVLAPCQTEVIHFHSHRQIGHRIVALQRFLKLRFLVRAGHLGEGGGSVVTLAVIQLGIVSPPTLGASFTWMRRYLPSSAELVLA